MKLWLLRPVEPRASENDPWEPWYDKAFGRHGLTAGGLGAMRIGKIRNCADMALRADGGAGESPAESWPF